MNVYLRNNILQASPNKLIKILYEALIANLIGIKKYNNERNFQESHNRNIKAQLIIEELIVSLDFEKGEEIANNLLSIYLYMLEKLTEANISKDSKAIDEVFDYAKQLLELWIQITGEMDFAS